MRVAEVREGPVGSGVRDIEIELQIHHSANRTEKWGAHQGAQKFSEAHGGPAPSILREARALQEGAGCTLASYFRRELRRVAYEGQSKPQRIHISESL